MKWGDRGTAAGLMFATDTSMFMPLASLAVKIEENTLRLLTAKLREGIPSECVGKPVRGRIRVRVYHCVNGDAFGAGESSGNFDRDDRGFPADICVKCVEAARRDIMVFLSVEDCAAKISAMHV